MLTSHASQEEEVKMNAKMSEMVEDILQSCVMLGGCKAKETTNESPPKMKFFS